MLNSEKTYYDFSNVLIKAKHSYLDSRSQINLTASFKNFEQDVFEGWNPVPVMSANMDTITDVEMAWALLERNWVPVLHKYVSKEDISSLFDKIDEYNKTHDKKIDYRNLFISRGTTEQDKEKLKERILAEPRIKSVCIDVANGHRDTVVSYAKELKETICKDKVLMVGNVGSSDMVDSYVKVGVDIIKCGIGPGCFHPNTKIITNEGKKKISEVKEGDLVLSHENEFKKVLATTSYEEKDKLISINGVLSTPSHKYLVVNPMSLESSWVEAYKLEIGDNLYLTKENDLTEITSIKEESYLGLVYDIEVEDHHSFTLESGVAVHNSACLTRVKTGVGMPQISLIDDVKQKIIELKAENKILIVSDGGCKVEGDIAKAFVAGADFVMIGGMLSGYKESPGVVEEIAGKTYKRFSGMAAKESQQNGVPSHGTEEGKTVMVPYKGKVYRKLEDIEGGLRSACTYVNAENIQKLKEAELIISTVQENKVFS